jgi:hypothetical protein
MLNMLLIMVQLMINSTMQYVYQVMYRCEQYECSSFNTSGLIVASLELVYSKMFQRQHERLYITFSTSFET